MVAGAVRTAVRGRLSRGRDTGVMSARLVRARRGAVAGAGAAGLWALLEPVAARAFGTEYTDVRLLGRLATEGPWWPVAGVVAHLASGAGFGAAAGAVGVRGPLAGALAASVEGIVAWPGMAVMDVVHPDRRSGWWPPLLVSPRVFAQEAVMHALFGAAFGALLALADDERG